MLFTKWLTTKIGNFPSSFSNSRFFYQPILTKWYPVLFRPVVVLGSPSARSQRRTSSRWRRMPSKPFSQPSRRAAATKGEPWLHPWVCIQVVVDSLAMQWLRNGVWSMRDTSWYILIPWFYNRWLTIWSWSIVAADKKQEQNVLMAMAKAKRLILIRWFSTLGRHLGGDFYCLGTTTSFGLFLFRNDNREFDGHRWSHFSVLPWLPPGTRGTVHGIGNYGYGISRNR